MVEANHPADQRDRIPATIDAKELVPVTDLLARDLEQPDAGGGRLALQAMPLTVGPER